MTFSWRRPAVPETAGLGIRVAAFVVDVLIASGAFVVMAGIVYLGAVWTGATAPDPDVRAVVIPIVLSYLPVLLIYFTASEALWHATPGKRILGLTVRRVDGETPTLFDSFIRNVLRFIWFVPVIGVLLAVVDVVIMHRGELDQRIGDLGARTLVVDAGQ